MRDEIAALEADRSRAVAVHRRSTAEHPNVPALAVAQHGVAGAGVGIRLGDDLRRVFRHHVGAQRRAVTVISRDGQHAHALLRHHVFRPAIGQVVACPAPRPVDRAGAVVAHVEVKNVVAVGSEPRLERAVRAEAVEKLLIRIIFVAVRHPDVHHARLKHLRVHLCAAATGKAQRAVGRPGDAAHALHVLAAESAQRQRLLRQKAVRAAVVAPEAAVKFRAAALFQRVLREQLPVQQIHRRGKTAGAQNGVAKLTAEQRRAGVLARQMQLTERFDALK